MKAVINPFVLRQTKNSPFSHYGGTFDGVLALVEDNFENAKSGYRDEVVLVSVPPEGFFSGVVQLEEGQELTGSFKARRDGESPRKQVLAKGATKIPAVSVDIVLYRSDLLADSGDNALEATADNWEVVSINASPVEGDMPIDPITLMHNHFGSDGGTDTEMSDSELVAALREGFSFWADKALCG